MFFRFRHNVDANSNSHSNALLMYPHITTHQWLMKRFWILIISLISSLTSAASNMKSSSSNVRWTEHRQHPNNSTFGAHLNRTYKHTRRSSRMSYLSNFPLQWRVSFKAFTPSLNCQLQAASRIFNARRTGDNGKENSNWFEIGANAINPFALIVDESHKSSGKWKMRNCVVFLESHNQLKVLTTSGQSSCDNRPSEMYGWRWWRVKICRVNYESTEKYD